MDRLVNKMRTNRANRANAANRANGSRCELENAVVPAARMPPSVSVRRCEIQRAIRARDNFSAAAELLQNVLLTYHAPAVEFHADKSPSNETGEIEIAFVEG